MSLLERASLVAEWVRYAEAKISVSGQLVQKTKGGRPEGGIARAARELRVPGKTEEARRKFVERAVKINTLWDETKEAARAAGLANTQSALLAIAREQSSEAQVSKVREIAACKSAPRRKSVPQVGSDNSQKMVAASAAQTGSEPTNTHDVPVEYFRSPPTVPLTEEDIPGFLDRRRFSSEDQRVFDEIMAAWTAYVCPLLSMAPEHVRGRFNAEVSRAGTAPGTSLE